MLRGLFGSKDPNKPTPPKNQIEVVCPSCGAAQYEPRLVVSTFCKKCGVHLSIRKKKVTASETTRSGAVGNDDLWNPPAAEEPPPPEEKAEPAEPVPPPTKEPVSEETPTEDASTLPEEIILDAEPDPAKPVADESAGVEAAAEEGFGAFLKASSDDPPEAAPTASNPAKTASTAGHLVPIQKGTPRPAPPVQPTAQQPTTLQRMMERGYQQQYFKSAACFDCGHEFKVSRSSKKANCSECGSLISLEDVEINMNSTQAIRTRGNVIIRKRGHVAASKIECQDLQCFGQIEANIHCSGKATFKTDARIVGEVHCEELIVEKGSDVEFVNGIHADRVRINGHITGSLHSTGKVIIANYGSVDGDVTARSVSIEPGGELNGAMNIIRQPAADGPLPSAD